MENSKTIYLRDRVRKTILANKYVYAYIWKTLFRDVPGKRKQAMPLPEFGEIVKLSHENSNESFLPPLSVSSKVFTDGN